MKRALLLLLAITSMSVPAHSQALARRRVTNTDGFVMFSPYQPREIKSLGELPASLREKIVNYLTARVGRQFYEQLRFDAGQIIDREKLYLTSPNARNYQWTVPAYMVRFKFERPDLGISGYYTVLHLDSAGNVIRLSPRDLAVNLPEISKAPEKARLISLVDAAAIAAQKNYTPVKDEISLDYDRRTDSFVWKFQEKVSDNGLVMAFRYLDISAHTGAVLREYRGTGIR